jgi:hypothetical protein
MDATPMAVCGGGCRIDTGANGPVDVGPARERIMRAYQASALGHGSLRILRIRQIPQVPEDALRARR